MESSKFQNFWVVIYYPISDFWDFDQGNQYSLRGNLVPPFTDEVNIDPEIGFTNSEESELRVNQGSTVVDKDIEQQEEEEREKEAEESLINKTNHSEVSRVSSTNLSGPLQEKIHTDIGFEVDNATQSFQPDDDQLSKSLQDVTVIGLSNIQEEPESSQIPDNRNPPAFEHNQVEANANTEEDFINQAILESVGLDSREEFSETSKCIGPTLEEFKKLVHGNNSIFSEGTYSEL